MRVRSVVLHCCDRLPQCPDWIAPLLGGHRYDGEAPPTRSYFDPGTGLCAVVVACVTLDEGVVIREVRNNICTDVTEVRG